MKKIILTFIVSLLYVNIFAQESDTSISHLDTINCEYEIIDEYPSYVKKNGENIGVIFTIEQAQQLDSYVELLYLFRQLNSSGSKIEDFYITIINDQNEKILTYELKVEELKLKLIDKEMIINELNFQLSTQKEINKKTEEQNQNNIEVVEELKKELTKEKTKRIVGITTTSTVGAILLALSIYFGIR